MLPLGEGREGGRSSRAAAVARARCSLILVRPSRLFGSVGRRRAPAAGGGREMVRMSRPGCPTMQSSRGVGAVRCGCCRAGAKMLDGDKRLLTPKMWKRRSFVRAEEFSQSLTVVLWSVHHRPSSALFFAGVEWGPHHGAGLGWTQRSLTGRLAAGTH